MLNTLADGGRHHITLIIGPVVVIVERHTE
jgi:hypothetical protein